MAINQKNFVAGLLYIVFGVTVAIAAAGYEIGTPYNMGPGFFPFGTGIALAIVGACVLGAAVLPGLSPSGLGTWQFKNLAIILSSVVLFGLVLEPLGLVIAIPVLLAVSSFAHPEFSWRTLLLLVLFLLPFTWAIFVLLLGLQFPLLPYFMTS